MSKPSSSGRCTQGEANVLSTTVRMPRLRADLGDRREVDELEQRIGRRLDPDHPRVGLDRGLELTGRVAIDVGEVETGRALAHALEQAPACRRTGRRSATTWRPRPAARAPWPSPPCPRRTRSRARRLRGRRCSARTPARGIVRARVVVALCARRATLHVGRGGVDRRDHRAGRRVGRLAGVDRAGEAEEACRPWLMSCQLAAAGS